MKPFFLFEEVILCVLCDSALNIFLAIEPLFLRSSRMEQPVTEEAVLPRLLASNALRANLSKHMTLNQMADHKASMIMTAASLMLTISVTQYDNSVYRFLQS